jgi:titin
LTWIDNANNETGFRVERAVGPQGKFKALTTTLVNATTYTDKVKAHAVYHYRVRAYNATGSSSWSNTVTVTEP